VTSEPDGTLVLEGETDGIAAKKIALEVTAASMQTSAGIVDRLRVRPSIPMGDGEIRDRIRNALLQEPAFARYMVYAGDAAAPLRQPEPSGNYIEAVVSDGVVTLNGQVESLSHKRLAGVLVWWVPGSRDVVNGLDVEPEEADSDDEIRDAVRTALEKDKLIRSDSIRVDSRNAIVTLEGVAANEEQAAMAEADAWYVFGVDGVVNHLTRLD
jgi:osmotically-inducible protein OsmY